jgi:hypothetical protein
MKKIVASVGLVALGAATLHATSVPGITAADAGKPWSISATLRGFYDDNFNSLPNAQDLGGYERDTFGFEVSPAVLFTFPWEQTTLSLGYTYSFKYYENAIYGTDNERDDQSHNFNLALNHAFNERYQIGLKDSFVIGQEPDLLRVGNAMETFQRIPGDNMRNYGTVVFDGQATRNLGYEIGYANSWYKYDDTGFRSDGFEVSPSLGGLLNRMEHAVHLDGRWTVLPQTVGVLGYQFREIGYTEDEPIAGPVFEPTFSDARNARVHYGYAGVDHTFRPDLSGSLRAGAQFIDYYNDPFTESDVSPYVLASLKWSYTPQSFVEVGFTHDLNATDQYFVDNDGRVTLSAESSVVYLQLRHSLTPKLFASVHGQFQNSSYNGGMMDGQDEQFWSAGVNFEYLFTPNFSAHVGYNYDRLDSDSSQVTGLTRDLDRNRVYIGLTARY